MGMYDTNTIGFVREVIELNYWNFTNISIVMSIRGANEDEVRGMLQVTGTWLGTLANSLTYLDLDLFYLDNGTLQVYPLSKLKELIIRSPYQNTNLQPIVPFIGNPFPALQKLSLERYREELGMFETSIMPSVQELDLRIHEGPMSNPSWKTNFPALTILRIDLNPEACTEELRTTLGFILTHFIGLVHLVFSSEFSPDSFDYWDLLTGGAPRSFDNLRTLLSLSDEVLTQEVGVAQEPVNGIYSLPSLRNLRG